MLLPALVLLALLAFAAPMVVLAGILLLPMLMSWATDASPGRPVTRAVLLFGLAASCPTLVSLWSEGDRMADAVALGTEIPTLAISWAAQAGGWLLTQLLPLLVSVAINRNTQAAIARLERRRADMLQEWN